jgi:hypothetical protein
MARIDVKRTVGSSKPAYDRSWVRRVLACLDQSIQATIRCQSLETGLPDALIRNMGEKPPTAAYGANAVPFQVQVSIAAKAEAAI